MTLMRPTLLFVLLLNGSVLEASEKIWPPLLNSHNGSIVACTKILMNLGLGLLQHPQDFAWKISKRELIDLTPPVFLSMTKSDFDFDKFAKDLSLKEAQQLFQYVIHKDLFRVTLDDNQLENHLARRLGGYRFGSEGGIKRLYTFNSNRLTGFQILYNYDRLHGTTFTSDAAFYYMQHDVWPSNMDATYLMRIIVDSNDKQAIHKLISLLRQNNTFWQMISSPRGILSFEVEFFPIFKQMVKQILDGTSQPVPIQEMNLFVVRLMINAIELADANGGFESTFRGVRAINYAEQMKQYCKILNDAEAAQKYQDIVLLGHNAASIENAKAFGDVLDSEAPETIKNYDPLAFKRELFDLFIKLDPR